ncbi:ankyrin repeat-containing domain protein [Trichophaea hybrida]|nr:ankyrin repeat-containing domain protein [Trichophaea hybrida]
MWVQYLMLCFTSPRMQNGFSKIRSWSPEDFRAYAEYLNEWPLIEYTFHYIKDHHDLGGPNEDVSQLVTALIRQLADNQASYFFGSFINFHFGHNYDNALPVNGYQETSENMKYSTLNTAADPHLPHVVQALLHMCTQDAPHAQRKTPLIISVQKWLAAATQLLLDLDDDKDTRDDSGRTALHYAAENGDEAMVQLLAEKGIDKRIRDNSQETALHIAVKKL